MIDYDIEIIKLEQHIRFYKPKIWKETIGSAIHVPMITIDEIKEILNSNIIPERLKEYPVIENAIKEYIEIRKDK